MPQVICTSKAAQFSPQIGGVRFFTSEVGRISEEITDEQANEFLKTPTFFRLHAGEPIFPKKPLEPMKHAVAPQQSTDPNKGGIDNPAF